MLTCALNDGVALYPVLLVEPVPQVGVQVGALVMDGVVVGVQPLTLLYGHLTQTKKVIITFSVQLQFLYDLSTSQEYLIYRK